MLLKINVYFNETNGDGRMMIKNPLVAVVEEGILRRVAVGPQVVRIVSSFPDPSNILLRRNDQARYAEQHVHASVF